MISWRTGWRRRRLRRFDPAFLRADAVIFHIPTTPVGVQLAKRPGQTWIAWSAESEANYPALADPEFMRHFDLEVSHRQGADVVIAYCQPDDWLPLAPLPPAPPVYEPAPAVFIASSRFDLSGRTSYVRKLMRHMAVDSYGRVLNNRHLAEDQGRSTKLELLRRYRFTLAFENSIAPDYVTEKFFDPLLVGSVPVYLGAPNVADFAPGRDCYIDVSDYAGPAKLAEHLVGLAADPERYARHLEWRTRPLAQDFVGMVQEQRLPAIERLCRILRARA